jgi:arylsulfatase A-like enzyme
MKRFAWLLLFAPACSKPEAPPVPDAQPNVLLIISDDQHWSDFGFMGSEEVRTPHLDGLAAEGVVFARGYLAAPLCRPSLATLATGLHPHQHKITGNDPPKGVPRAQMLKHMQALETLPDLLVGAGYRAMQTGKWWEGPASLGGFTEGMTHGDTARGGRHGDVGLQIGRKGLAEATDFIDDCSAEGTPWFLWYAPFLPHTPHNPPAEWLDQYTKEGVPLPIEKYRAMCAWFDQTCGDLLQHLDERGLRENTLVVFVTDNGWIQRPDANGYAPRSKRTAYEGGIRTPVILRWPGKPLPETRETPISSVDIPATILAACGIEIPAHWPGRDLREVGRDGAAPRGPVFGTAGTHDLVSIDDPRQNWVTRWVLRDPYKLMIHRDPSRAPELYDVRADPAELRPLDKPALQAELRGLLDQWWSASSN